MSLFSQRLRECMETCGFNQSSLAVKLATNQSTVNRWLNGSIPHASVRAKLADALEVEQSWLIGSGEPVVLPTPSGPASTDYRAQLRALLETLGCALPVNATDDQLAAAIKFTAKRGEASKAATRATQIGELSILATNLSDENLATLLSVARAFRK